MVGNRKQSLEQKIGNSSNFAGGPHYRQLTDLSQQNLIGYKGIGANLGGLKGEVQCKHFVKYLYVEKNFGA